MFAGQPRTPQHLKWYYDAATSTANLAKRRGFRTRLLFPTPRPDVDGPSDGRVISEQIATLGSLGADSLILLFAIGHGHFDGRQSWFLANDGMVASEEFSRALRPVGDARVVAAFTPCQSGQFIEALRGRNRVVITSTLATEDNRASFAEALRDGLATASDVAQAFEFARSKVEEWYRRHGFTEVLEHPQISDLELARGISLD